IVRDDSGAPWLAEGRDPMKDQSYFLYASPRSWLERLVFPLGESTKTEVRAEAIARALPGATKGESQELCFVGSGAGADPVFADGVSLAPSRCRARVRVRYRHDGATAAVERTSEGAARVTFDEPVRAVTRGQVAVFYDGDRVLGGGRIARALGQV